MFKSFRTSTKLLILCGAFLISIARADLRAGDGEADRHRLCPQGACRQPLSGHRARHLRGHSRRRLGQRRPRAPRQRRNAPAPRRGAGPRARAEFETAELAQALDRALAPAVVATGQPAHRRTRWRWPRLPRRRPWRGASATIPTWRSIPISTPTTSSTSIVRTLPTLLGQLAEVQDHVQSSIAVGSIIAGSRRHACPCLASLVRATAAEVKDNLAAAYRGNADGRLRRAVDGAFAAMLSSMPVLPRRPRRRRIGRRCQGHGRNPAAFTPRAAAKTPSHAWALACSSSSTGCLQPAHRRSASPTMWLGLALIGALAGLSIAHCRPDPPPHRAAPRSGWRPLPRRCARPRTTAGASTTRARTRSGAWRRPSTTCSPSSPPPASARRPSGRSWRASRS